MSSNADIAQKDHFWMDTKLKPVTFANRCHDPSL